MDALGVTLYPPEIDEGDVFRTLEPECAGKLVSTIGHFRGGEKLAGMRELRVFEKDPRPGDYPEWEEDRAAPRLRCRRHHRHGSHERHDAAHP